MTHIRNHFSRPETDKRKRLALVMTALAFLVSSLAVASAASAKRTARTQQEAREVETASSSAFHPATRTAASPAGGQPVPVNPPALLWPAAVLGDGRYSVRLSRDPVFASSGTLQAEGLRWAMFNPHQKLEPGRWFWQYAIQKPGQPPQWSDRYAFVVDATNRVFLTPAADSMLASFPNSHPRILAKSEELADLRQRAAAQPDCQTLIEKARRLVKAKLPGLEKAKATGKGTTAFQDKNFAKWASKGFAADFAQDITVLAPAYLLTGDEAIGLAALQRALFVAALDPDGDTSPRVSDFADGSCMRAMALAYDSCFALLDSKEQDLLRKAMEARASRFFRQHINKLEGRIFNAHVWQHVLMEAAEIAFATLGELPEARTWTAYVYELWLNRFPTLGGDDGGWTEGLGYLAVNFETMLLMPQRLNQLTGADFYDVPWYRNVPSFHIYGWPNRSVSAGFGDGDHATKSISAARAYFVETLGRRFGNPQAVKYAETVMARKSDSLPPLLAWHRLREPAGKMPLPALPSELPLSRAFRDVGFVAMHTDLADSQSNAFIAFNSCPFGASGHMHPCQNAFNLMLGGERLFANSGYYIAYGDAHFEGWYHNTRGHNTVLIDGQGQPSGSEAWGWVARHADSRSMAYCLGDASRAYGKTGLTRFRRHLVLLRPATLVIYDELEADHDAQWSWLLHSPAPIKSDPGGVRLHATVPTGKGQVDVYGSLGLQVKIDDRFDPPADNWRGKKSGGKPQPYPNQWHATIEPVQKTARMRYLALIQLRLEGQQEGFTDPKADGGGRIQLGPWTVQAALNPRENASLVIQRTDGQSALAADIPSLTAGGQRHTLSPGETILVEGRDVFRAPDQGN